MANKVLAVKAALSQASQLMDKYSPNVHTVMRGTKVKNGVDTGEPCVVFLVELKIAKEVLAPSRILPTSIQATPNEVVPTDVVECPPFKAQQTPHDRIRPAPAGVSCGHVNITTGTLGGWVHRITDPASWFVLTNAHVGANTNAGEAGDQVLQPGPFDGGQNTIDRIGTLYQRVAIHFGNNPPDIPTCPNTDPPPPPPPDDPPDKKKKKSGVSTAYWKGTTALINAIPKLIGCPFRVKVINESKLRLRESRSISIPFCIPQPWPNIVDACIVGPVTPDNVNPVFFDSSPAPIGVRDPDIGDAVTKFGRTTWRTDGTVVGMEATTRVDYGPDGIATFTDQVIVEGSSSDFSSGGDSGSWILSEDGMLVGLLFAGGGGTTVANRITNVFSLLGLRL